MTGRADASCLFECRKSSVEECYEFQWYSPVNCNNDNEITEEVSDSPCKER